jgi:DGQHR domain-containing protein
MAIKKLHIRTPVPAIQGGFGERLVSYSTQISPSDIGNVLGHDPRDKMRKKLAPSLRKIYDFLQRKTSKDRREGIAGYINDRLGPDPLAVGAFPSISIAIQRHAEFTPSKENENIGTVFFDLSASSVRVLIDGLGRVTGALDVLDMGRNDLVERFTFPVTFYAPAQGTPELTMEEMGQLFHDFNFRVQPVSKQHALPLDQSDIYIALARKLGHEPFIADNGGVAERAASLGKKSTEFVVQTVLVRTVRGACEGRKFQEANLTFAENPNLTRETFPSMLQSISVFFSHLANVMGPRFTDRSSLLLSASGWQALGVIHHELVVKLKLEQADLTRALDKIAAIDWSRHNEDWLKLGIGHPEVDKSTGKEIHDEAGRPKIALSGAGRTTTQHLINYMIEKAGLATLLKERDFQASADVPFAQQAEQPAHLN